MATTLARKFRLDVTTDLTLAGGFTQVNGLESFDPEINPTVVDTTAYDTSGFTTSEVTLYDWMVTATFFRRIVSTVYDPGQEILRACQGLFGTSARVGARWYDKNGGTEAYSGVALVTWKRTATTAKDAEQIIATLTGTDIALNINISNPIAGALVPVVTGVTPGSAAATNAIAIIGQYFTGTTGATHVTIGGVNATSYTVQSDNLITAVMPAGSAGSAPVIVTNVAGAGASFPYTRT